MASIDSEALWNSDFTALAPRVRSGDITSVALTELMLERILAQDGALHSYVQVSPDTARAAAAAADAEIRAGHYRGALHGIAMAVKDVFYTTDMQTGLGSPIYAHWQAPYESTATQRLREAGAVMLGKLTCTEGVYAQHHPSITEPINPFGAAHWTGNSSSGSGVAVTAGLAFATLGTDTGGSIRLPSSCCGLVGIKPSWGRVSRHGVFPLAESLDHVGPMARSVKDAAFLLGVIAGADPADPTASLEPVPDYLDGIDDGIHCVTIGIDWQFLRARASDEVVASIEDMAATLSGLGAKIVTVEFPDPDAILRGWHTQCAAEAALAHRDTFPSRRADYGERLSALLDFGAAVTGLELAAALKARRDFNGAVARMFADIDLFLVPGLPVAGPTLAYMATLGPDPDGILAVGPFNAPFDVCGYPTLTMPCGASQQGIPIGGQFVAKPFQEALLCRAGQAYQSVTTWHRRRPGL